MLKSMTVRHRFQEADEVTLCDDEGNSVHLEGQYLVDGTVIPVLMALGTLKGGVLNSAGFPIEGIYEFKVSLGGKSE